MDRREFLASYYAKKGMVSSKFKRKDWSKKLESALGRPIRQDKAGGIVYLVVDCSGSMAEGNKIDQAKKGALGFAKEARNKGYAVGLIQFASHAEHISEPQNELASLRTGIERIAASGSTNMAEAIRMAIDKLVDKAGTRVMCIVTDGMPDNPRNALDAANEARRECIDVMTIGTDDADRDFLERLATRRELAIKVSRDQLDQGIASMVKMLPGKSK